MGNSSFHLCLILFLALTRTISVTASIARLVGNTFGNIGRNATYDYIVIGGGTSGLTIASRLAEDPKNTVAVIEAGNFYEIDNGNGSTIPGIAGVQYLGTDPTDVQPLIDWGFVTAPQKEVKNRRLHYARGKTLGGTSGRNYMAYQRPTKDSMRKWAEEVGDDSYSWAQILPFYKRSTTVSKPDDKARFANATVREDFAAYDNSLQGPLRISWPKWGSPLSSWILKAGEALGIKPRDGFNNGELLGSAWYATTINPKTAHRDSSFTSFLETAMEQTTIKIYKQTLAKKILFDANRAASGVVVSSSGIQYTLTAAKEVILSAGVFQSPQLLMVSGVGPRRTLQKHGIPIVADLPGVGQNMQDHAASSIAYRVKVDTASKLVGDPLYAAKAGMDYLESQSGPLTAPAGALLWEKFQDAARSNFSRTTRDGLAKYPNDWPEAEYLVIDAFMGDNSQYWSADPADGYNYGSLMFGLITPFSRGSVSIASANAENPPVIDPRYLTDVADREMMVAAFRRVRELWDQIPEVTIGPEYYPGPNITTDEQILNYIQDSFTYVFHASATCKMGKANDRMAVVDSKARVLGGVKRLRVVDASAFPFLPPGHPQATCYMLAEKIAESIKRGDYCDNCMLL